MITDNYSDITKRLFISNCKVSVNKSDVIIVNIVLKVLCRKIE